MKISASTIERIYFKGGIRFKYINRVKRVIDFTSEYYSGLFTTMCNLLEKAKTDKVKTIYLDEAVFTFNTFSKKAWSAGYSSISVLDSKIRMKA